MTAPSELAHRVLPGMTERGFGRIVNVASLAGLVPGGPGATLYGASKAFLVRFSQSLHLEVRGAGVHVSALCPGFTYSEFHDANDTRAQITRSTPEWLWMGADEVAAAGYEAAEANRPICVTGAPNKAIAALGKLIPDEWAMALIASQAGGGLAVQEAVNLSHRQCFAEGRGRLGLSAASPCRREAAPPAHRRDR